MGSPSLRDRGELNLLDAIARCIPTSAGVRCGPGDDAAVLAPSRYPWVLTTDALVEGVHFRRPWLPPRALGWRAFQVSVSDIAAMGGRPRAALLAIEARPDMPAADLQAIVAGARDAALAAGAALAGGNLARARSLALTVTVVGDAPASPVGRDGARAGDQLFVTGTLGGAALGLRQLAARRAGRRAAAVARWRRPVARLRAGCALARRRIASAMIDVSDGLLIDAERLCRASGVAARLAASRLPLHPALRMLPPRAALALALGGGEDYELLFAVRPARVAALARVADALGCPVRHVGEVVPRGRDARVTVLDARARPLALPRRRGHQHFAR